jgi:hypothetical protein
MMMRRADMSVTDHPAVAAYKANKAQYDIDNYLNFIRGSTSVESQCGDLLGVLDTPEFVALMKTQVNPDPFKAIVDAVPDLDLYDLQWLEKHLPITSPAYSPVILRNKEIWSAYGGLVEMACQPGAEAK